MEMTSVLYLLLFLLLAGAFYKFVIARKYGDSSQDAPAVRKFSSGPRYRNRTWSRRLNRRCVAIARAKDPVKMQVLCDPAFYRALVREVNKRTKQVQAEQVLA